MRGGVRPRPTPFRFSPDIREKSRSSIHKHPLHAEKIRYISHLLMSWMYGRQRNSGFQNVIGSGTAAEFGGGLEPCLFLTGLGH
jgi:hypothetical protein